MAIDEQAEGAQVGSTADEWGRKVLDAIDQGIVVHGPDGAISYANAAAERLLGLSADAVRARSSLDPQWRAVDRQGRPFPGERHPASVARRSGRPVLDELMGVARSDGSLVWLRVSAWPLPGGTAGSQSVVAQLADVTAQRGSSERLGLQARLLDAVGQAVMAIRLDGTIVYWNPAAERMTGWDTDEVIGRLLSDVTPVRPQEGRTEEVLARLAAGEPWTGEVDLRRRDGTSFTVVVTNSPWTDEDGELIGIIGVSLDISERLDVEQKALRRADAQAAVARLGHQALRSTDLDDFLADAVLTVVEAVDADVANILEAHEGGGYLRVRATAGWPEGERWNGSSFPVEPGSGYERAARTGTPVAFEDLAARPGRGPWGEELFRSGLHNVAIVPLSGRTEVVGCLIASSRTPGRISDADTATLQSIANVVAAAFERDRADSELQHLALHDQLTGLPNRTLFTDRMELALTRRRRQGGDVALLFSDLDRFKQVNDGLGHAVGDRLLVAVANRMQTAVRASDTVARLAGDEFAVLCEDLAGPDDAAALADRLALACAAPFVIDGHDVTVSTSIGIALAGDDDTPDTLLRHADQAMYEAKEAGRNRYEVYDDVLASTVVSRRSIAEALRGASSEGKLSLRYQPVHDLGSGDVRVVEALLRWQQPGRGLLEPSAFLDIAEETGSIVEMGTWALDEACRRASSWGAAGQAPDVAVNLSPRQLAHPGLVPAVASALAAHRLEPGRLWLEVTEAAVMRHPEATARTLSALEELGVRIAIDDFGTGYSSLSSLRRVPVHALKIDRSFVSGDGPGLHDRSVVAAVVGLAHSLGLTVVAEGVETREQLDALRALRCDLGQGYYWSPPLAPDALEALGSVPG